MTKFWMMVIAILVLGLLAGCTDEGDCASDPSLCDPDSDTDTDAGADADSDATETGDDADADADNDSPMTTCDGGWLDPATSLCWQEPPWTDWANWDDAVAYCDGLSSAGHGPGSWHLPTISELRSFVRGCPATETMGTCGVTDACLDYGCWNISCDGCSNFGGPGARGVYWPAGLGGDNLGLWSSSSYTGGVSNALYINFDHGSVVDKSKVNAGGVRCVR